MSVKDLLGRPIVAGDYVVFYNNIYQIEGVSQARKDGYGIVKICLVEKSNSTKSVVKQSYEMCKIPADDVLIWKLTQ